MKSIKVLFLSLLLFNLMSCSSYLDKPIVEELTENELKKSLTELDIDSTLYFFNKEISVFRDSLNSNNKLKNKFKSLLYSDWYELVKLNRNKELLDSLEANYIKPKYNSLYKEVNKKIDSLVDSYYSNKIKLEDYVKVEVGDIDTDYYSYSGGISDVSIGFRLTPLKGGIQQILFKHTYSPKIGGKEYVSRHRSTRPFSRSVLRYWEVGYSERNILGGETVNTLKRDFNSKIEILKIRYKNENFSNDELDIPFEVRMRRKYSEGGDEDEGKVLTKNEKIAEDLLNGSMVESYNEEIAENLLEMDYKRYSEFKRPIEDSIYRSKIPKYDLLMEMFNIRFELTY